MGIFQEENLCVFGICIAITVGVVVMIKVIRDRRAKKRRLRIKRSSLQKYPSFVGNRITGIFTILPPVKFKDSRRLSEQYIIAVSPPIDFYDSSLGFYERLYPYPYPGRAIRRESDDSTSSDFEYDYHNHSPMKQEIEDENNNVITMKIHDSWTL